MPMPKVTTSVIDLSARVTSEGTYNSAIVVAAKKGPIDTPTLVTSQTDFLERFTPDETLQIGWDTALYEAYIYLAQQSNLYVVRAANTTTDPALYGGCAIKTYKSEDSNAPLEEGFANEELQGTVIDGSYMKLETRPDIKGALAISRIKDMPNDEENVKAYVQEFRECIEYVSELNFRTAHLFFSGPNEIAAFMMPYFVNSKDIILYRYVVQRQGYIRLDQVDARR